MNKQSQESEAYGCMRILGAFKPVFPEARILQNIIMPMDGFGGCPTAEFDVIVVCTAGVFVFEIKGHAGRSIEIKKTDDGAHRWKIHKEFGEVEIQDPLAQGGRKIRYLRESIRGCLVRGFVYFTNDSIALPPDINADVITSKDLEYLVRTLRYDAKRRDRLQTEDSIKKIVESILEISHDFTMDEHIHNCLKTQEFKRSNAQLGVYPDFGRQKKYPHPEMRVLTRSSRNLGMGQNTSKPGKAE